MLSHSYALYSSLLDKDKYQTAQAHQQGIEAVRNNVEGSELGEAGCCQKLCAIGNEALTHGAEHIQQ